MADDTGGDRTTTPPRGSHLSLLQRLAGLSTPPQTMGRDFTAVFTTSLVLLLCPGPEAFVPSPTVRGGPLGSSSAQLRVPDASLVTARRRCRPINPRTYSSAQQEANSDQDSGEHDGRGSDRDHRTNRSAPQRPPPLPPPSAPASVVLFRVLRGGNP
ncbi:unnamed protein product, partial [Scytosiphon promiscuus]